MLTLKEKATIADPYYVFVFVSSENQSDTLTWTAPNQSTYTTRFDEFNVEVVTSSGSENLLNGQLYLTDNEYYYYVYQASSFGLSHDGTMVEKGRVKVAEASSSNPEYTDQNTYVDYE